jgi:hypothetical protein
VADHYQKEDGSGNYQLEDGSGAYLLESIDFDEGQAEGNLVTQVLPGVIKGLRAVALAATLLAAQTQLSYGHEDEVPLTPAISEDYVVVQPVVERLIPRAVLDDDVIVPAAAQTALDETEWIPRPPPQIRPPIAFTTDDEIVSQLEDEGWIPNVPLAFKSPLAITADDELPTVVTAAGPTEDWWIVQPPAMPRPPQALVDDDVIVPAAAPAGPTEDWWIVTPPPPYRPPRAVADDDVLPTFVPGLGEDYWVIWPVVTRVLPTPPITIDDEIPSQLDESYLVIVFGTSWRELRPFAFTADEVITAPAGPLDEGWIAFPPPLRTPPRAVTADDEIATTPPTGIPDEDWWIAQPPPPRIPPQAVTADDEIATAPAAGIPEEIPWIAFPPRTPAPPRAITADEEIATFPGIPDEDWWITKPPPVRIPSPAVTADDEIATAPPVGLSEDYWVAWWAYEIPSVPAITDDDVIVSVVAQLGLDEEGWIASRPFSAGRIVALTADDELATFPGIPEETEWIARPPTPSRSVPAVTADDEIAVVVPITGSGDVTFPVSQIAGGFIGTGGGGGLSWFTSPIPHLRPDKLVVVPSKQRQITGRGAVSFEVSQTDGEGDVPLIARGAVRYRVSASRAEGQIALTARGDVRRRVSQTRGSGQVMVLSDDTFGLEWDDFIDLE